MERLQKVIASSGYTSRRKAEELIASGQVYVNGKQVTELGTKVSSGDSVVVEGVTLTQEKKEYYLLNKPRGYICSLSDEHQRKVVTELIETKARIYPVGRLDYDTTGLLILTNDGELANKLMHPSNHIDKKYVAKIEGSLTMAELFAIKSGVIVDGVKCIPQRVKIKSRDTQKNVSLVEIVIVEGRKHIVKNIFEQVGHQVLKLKREEYAFLNIRGLNSGDYRKLSRDEVKNLYDI